MMSTYVFEFANHLFCFHKIPLLQRSRKGTKCDGKISEGLSNFMQFALCRRCHTVWSRHTVQVDRSLKF